MTANQLPANRTDDGRRPADELMHLKGSHPIVLGLPRGGIPVAAKLLQRSMRRTKSRFAALTLIPAPIRFALRWPALAHASAHQAFCAHF